MVASKSCGLLNAELVMGIDVHMACDERQTCLSRLRFTMLQPVVCVGAQSMMHMKDEKFYTTLLAGSRCEMEQHRRVETATESECDTFRNDNARQNVFQRALKYRIQCKCGITQRT